MDLKFSKEWLERMCKIEDECGSPNIIPPAPLSELIKEGNEIALLHAIRNVGFSSMSDRDYDELRRSMEEIMRLTAHLDNSVVINVDYTR